MNHLTTHTAIDRAALDLAGVDPDSTEPRHRATSCLACRASTWNQMGYCDRHWVRPDAIDRKLDGRG